MSDFISMDDYKDAQGNIDWKSYEKAAEDNGEKCPRCRVMIYPPQGIPTICAGCEV